LLGPWLYATCERTARCYRVFPLAYPTAGCCNNVALDASCRVHASILLPHTHHTPPTHAGVGMRSQTPRVLASCQFTRLHFLIAPIASYVMRITRSAVWLFHSILYSDPPSAGRLGRRLRGLLCRWFLFWTFQHPAYSPRRWFVPLYAQPISPPPVLLSVLPTTRAILPTKPQHLAGNAPPPRAAHGLGYMRWAEQRRGQACFAERRLALYVIQRAIRALPLAS